MQMRMTDTYSLDLIAPKLNNNELHMIDPVQS